MNRGWVKFCKMKMGKCPGTDGLTTEFYKAFWAELLPYYRESLVFSFQAGELSLEQKRGIVTLIPKKDVDRKFLKNWRPISLLNVDYKITSKVIANRMKKVLPDLINNSQTFFLKRLL